MALPDFGVLANGTALVFRASGGDATFNPAGLANGSSHQSAKANFGADRSWKFEVWGEMDFGASTPTAKATLDLWCNASPTSGASDNLGGTSGSDGSYTAAAHDQLEPAGAFVCIAASGVQKAFMGYYSPSQQYVSIVLQNNSGVALANPASSVIIRFYPLQEKVID